MNSLTRIPGLRFLVAARVALFINVQLEFEYREAEMRHGTSANIEDRFYLSFSVSKRRHEIQ